MKALKVDIQTGKEEYIETDEEFNFPPSIEPKGGIDFEKLKQVLLDKGIIKDKLEIEPDKKSFI
jgi:hypothetical protein